MGYRVALRTQFVHSMCVDFVNAETIVSLGICPTKSTIIMVTTARQYHNNEPIEIAWPPHFRLTRSPGTTTPTLRKTNKHMLPDLTQAPTISATHGNQARALLGALVAGAAVIGLTLVGISRVVSNGRGRIARALTNGLLRALAKGGKDLYF